MPSVSVRIISLTLFLAMGCGYGFAQVTGDQTGGGQTGGGQTGGGQTGGGGASAGNTGTGSAITVFDPDAAFSNIQRGDAIGATGGTGTGFSIVGAGEAGRRGLGGFGGLGGLGGIGGFGNFSGVQSTGSQMVKPIIRTRLRSAIDTAPLPSEIVQYSANQHLRTIPDRARLGGVGVVMDGPVAVISGVVSNDRDRRMSELLMRLEPGVRGVENRVIVRPPGSGR